MKNKMILCTLLSGIVLTSCKKEAAPAAPIAEKPLQVDCYQALYEKDTVTLILNTLKDGKVSGNMTMKEVGNPTKNGDILGEIHGDTLLVDYSFVLDNKDKTTYKNPLALLKKGDELILGNGKIETYLGKTYFVKGQPIDYEKVKYKFTKTDCKE